jgi:hypothetical protein
VSCAVWGCRREARFVKQASNHAKSAARLLDVKCKVNQKAPNHTPRGPERDQSTDRGRQPWKTHDTAGKPWIPCARLLPPPVNLCSLARSSAELCPIPHAADPGQRRVVTLDLVTKSSVCPRQCFASLISQDSDIARIDRQTCPRQPMSSRRLF